MRCRPPPAPWRGPCPTRGRQPRHPRRSSRPPRSGRRRAQPASPEIRTQPIHEHDRLPSTAHLRAAPHRHRPSFTVRIECGSDSQDAPGSEPCVNRFRRRVAGPARCAPNGVERMPQGRPCGGATAAASAGVTVCRDQRRSTGDAGPLAARHLPFTRPNEACIMTVPPGPPTEASAEGGGVPTPPPTADSRRHPGDGPAAAGRARHPPPPGRLVGPLGLGDPAVQLGHPRRSCSRRST